MHLDTRERAILEGFVLKEGRVKRLAPMIAGADIVMAVVVYLAFPEEDWKLWVAIGLVVMGFGAAFVLSRTLDRGAGSATSVLAGRDSSRTVAATVVDRNGHEPYPWSLRLQEELGNGRRFAHIGVDAVDWRPEPGESISLTLFGEERRSFRGVAYVTAGGSSTRHWLYSVNLSAQSQYVHNPS